MGRVEDGTTISDFDPEEAKRKASLSASVVPVEYEGIKYNLIDAPGLFDFEAGEYEGIRAAESVLVCVSGRSGVTVGAEKGLSSWPARNGKATMVFVSKCDLENANYFKILEDMKIKVRRHPSAPASSPAKARRRHPPYAAVIRAHCCAITWNDLAENRTTKLTRTYHLTVDDLSAIRECICALDPRPGSSFSQRKSTVYVVPDLTIVRDGAGFAVRVTGELSETVVINRTYDRMAEQGRMDAEAREWLEQKRAEADAVLANIDQRRQTLHRFGVYLAEVQYDFFTGGEARMRPLTMQQAADALGVHVSTISRTVQDKHVLTPWGVYPLKHFFSSSVACSAEERRHALSSLAIKDRIKDLVAGEDRRKPLSDATITTILNGEGVDIKRRTVAKYREALGIGRQSQRRR